MSNGSEDNEEIFPAIEIKCNGGIRVITFPQMNPSNYIEAFTSSTEMFYEMLLQNPARSIWCDKSRQIAIVIQNNKMYAPECVISYLKTNVTKEFADAHFAESMLNWSQHRELYERYKNYSDLTVCDSYILRDMEIMKKQRQHALNCIKLQARLQDNISTIYDEIICKSIDLGEEYAPHDYVNVLTCFIDMIYQDVLYTFKKQEQFVEKLYHYKKILSSVPNFVDAKTRFNQIMPN